MKAIQFGRALVKLNRGILGLPVPWRSWNMLLAVVNGVVPVFFLRHLEAQLVWVAFLASFLLMTVLCGMTGFSRLLGLGHILWIPLLWFLWVRLDQIPADSAFGIWIRLLMVVNALSLVIDAIDVSRYVSGDRVDAMKG